MRDDKGYGEWLIYCAIALIFFGSLWQMQERAQVRETPKPAPCLAVEKTWIEGRFLNEFYVSLSGGIPHKVTREQFGQISPGECYKEYSDGVFAFQPWDLCDCETGEVIQKGVGE